MSVGYDRLPSCIYGSSSWPVRWGEVREGDQAIAVALCLRVYVCVCSSVCCLLQGYNCAKCLHLPLVDLSFIKVILRTRYYCYRIILVKNIWRCLCCKRSLLTL